MKCDLHVFVYLRDFSSVTFCNTWISGSFLVSKDAFNLNNSVKSNVGRHLMQMFLCAV